MAYSVNEGGTVGWTGTEQREDADPVEGRSLVSRRRATRSALLTADLEAVALQLFHERGFNNVTVDEIAATAQISPRTFYRYCPTKEDLLLLRIERRSAALAAALAARPAAEPPLSSIRHAFEAVIAAEDEALARLWIDVIVGTPSVLRVVIGAIQLKSHRVVAAFVGDRLGVGTDELVPTILAAAVGGVIQATQTRWYFEGGDLAATISHGLRVLEQGVGSDLVPWTTDPPVGEGAASTT